MSNHTVCHIEFFVSDLVKAQKFYEGLFGWTFRQFTDDMVVFGVGDKHVGGLMRREKFIPGDTPSVWVQVEQIEPMLEKATKLGGKITSPKGEVPHVGWSAQIRDADGNPIGIVQFSEAGS